MNWKIILQLSVFGLIMAFGTISLIPQPVEPIFWLMIFVVSAWVIAKTCASGYFLHGFLVSLVNCVWITGAHIIFRDTYVANHPQMVALSAHIPHGLATHPRLAMAVTGLAAGVLSGLILGLLAYIASKFVKKREDD